MSRNYELPAHFFNPDDKRSYLLMVFQSTPLVCLAVPAEGGGFRLFDFPDKTGIYALYLTETPISDVIPAQRRAGDLAEADVAPLKHDLVYVGKTSGKGRLRRRLSDHYHKIDSRQGLSVDRILVRYLAIEHDWNTLFAEYHLIEAPELVTHPPPTWNTNGFGSHAPGAGRPGKRAKPPAHFDVLYPTKPCPP
ncbi:MAG: Eco29kI family restriction endonuclease [Planctomycetes bacterium]|nr:Eco29kI family restriction endonuclease [Planctomycetota bacterium]